MIDLTTNPVHDELVRAVSETAPACPECSGRLGATDVQRHHDWSEMGTNDSVIWAVELYRCQDCRKRIVRKFELDRETAAEREHEREKAIARAKLREELWMRAGLLAPLKYRQIEQQVQDAFPKRPDPDLFERYREARGV